MYIECDSDALELLTKSFDISNPNYNDAIKSILEKVDTYPKFAGAKAPKGPVLSRPLWTTFNYKVSLRLNKYSKQKEPYESKRPVSLASFHHSIREKRTYGTFKFLHFLIIGKNFQLLQYIIENQQETAEEELWKGVLVNHQSSLSPEMIVDEDRWILGANCIHLAAKFMPRGLNLILTRFSTTTLKTETNLRLSPLHIAARNNTSLSTR
jgi:hypothetical protein